MKKILVADLVGTLIPGCYNHANYLYGDGTFAGDYNGLEASSDIIYKNWDKVFAHLSIFLREFIRDGNEVNVVTSIDSHMIPKEMLEKLIKKLYACLGEERGCLNVFFQTHNLEDTVKSLSTCSEIKNADNLVKCVTPSGLEMIFLREKRAVFDHIPVNGNSIYTIGDTELDLDMLKKSLALGGKADFINYDLYLSKEELKTTLARVHIREESVLCERIAHERYPEFYQLNNEARAEILNGIRAKLYPPGSDYREFLKSLYDKAFTGELDINREMIINQVFDILNTYNAISCYDFLGLNREPIPISTCYDIGMYPTFGDYYTRVLKK